MPKLFDGDSLTRGNVMKYVIQLLSLVILFVVSPMVMATTMCKTSEVHLASMQLLSGGPVLNLPTDPGPNYDLDGRTSTSCVGLLSGNDQPLPSTNIGQYGDGLLNGAVQSVGNSDPQLDPVNKLFDPLYDNGDSLAFIDKSQLQDLDGIGGFNDPGWVFLGKDEGKPGGFDTAIAGKDLTGEINVSEVLDIEFTCSVGVIDAGKDEQECTKGTWDVKPLDGIVDKLKPLFGNGFFDHLAFVFKAGNDFAIYDFDFNLIKAELGGGIDLTVPYLLSGSFDLGSLKTDTFGGKGISHISLWARDPSLDFVISEPQVNLLMFFGLVMLLIRIKSKKALIG